MTGVRFSELTGGSGHTIVAATRGPDLRAYGYREIEYAASGSVVGRTIGAEGVEMPVAAREYTTRLLVRRPKDPAAFNGVVVAEWFNVSSGSDAAPEYTYLAEEMVRAGYAWVGISAQYTGIEGGGDSVGLSDTAARGLAAKDPERYAELHHPGDAYCFDIFAAIGRALRAPAPGGPLDGLAVQHLLAVGESQSAMALTTYASVFARDHEVFDGFLIHSRAAAGMPLGKADSGIDIDTVFGKTPTLIGDAAGVPVFVVQTETDVLTNFESHRSREPDTNLMRTWEIAGTAHADLFQIGKYEHLLGCPTPVNRGQQVFVLRAALDHLRRWVDDGTPPPTGEPLRVESFGGTSYFVPDDVGNATGGIRTPCVEVPTELLCGVVTGDVSRICVLFGSTIDLDAPTLARRYPDTATYLARYRDATDAMIKRGYALAEDRQAILDDARPGTLPFPAQDQVPR